MATAIQNDEAESNEEKVPDWILAKRGISMLINNNAKDAQELFRRYPDSLPMFAGYSFATFMDALMTFEEDKLNLATSVLREVERRCTSDTGWLHSVKRVFAGGGGIPPPTLAENLETQIILADSQVCLAVLTFLQQDISGYFRGGWALRKAWKAYQSAYRDVFGLHRRVVGAGEDRAASAPLPLDWSPPNGYIPHSRSLHDAAAAALASAASTLRKSPSVDGALSGRRPTDGEWTPARRQSGRREEEEAVDGATAERLMGAVCFGYGLFQLGISLLPPSLLKITNLLGFGGSRQTGIACLMYARQGVDMRAPLATLSLLWYHTIVRPFYALDGSNVQAGVDAATQLLQESESEYGRSALFLFFKGRCHRLNSDIAAALAAFRSAADEGGVQREIRVLALHEVGWCHLIRLDYAEAEAVFGRLRTCSRWSRQFYAYLSRACRGAAGGEGAGPAEAPKGGAGQLDEFLRRRAARCRAREEGPARPSALFWRMLVYEMLYLWNAMASCSEEGIESIAKDCEQVRENPDAEPMLGLSRLILGSCYCIQRKYTEGIVEFRMCLEERKHLPNNAIDAHISAFSQYELGYLLVKSIETKTEGKQLLQDISNYKDYDFEQRLNVRVHSILKQL